MGRLRIIKVNAQREALTPQLYPSRGKQFGPSKDLLILLRVRIAIKTNINVASRSAGDGPKDMIIVRC